MPHDIEGKPHIFYEGGLWVLRSRLLDRPFQTIRDIQRFYQLGYR